MSVSDFYKADYDPFLVKSGFLSIKGNNVCNDCGEEGPEWASIPFGVLVCLACSGKHRSYGVDITTVRSLKLDTWDEYEDDVNTLVSSGGNAAMAEYLSSVGWKHPLYKNGSNFNQSDLDATIAHIYASAELGYYKYIVRAKASSTPDMELTPFDAFRDQFEKQSEIDQALRLEHSVSLKAQSNSLLGDSGKSENANHTAAHRFLGTVEQTADGAHWVPDRIVNECMICSAEFHLFYRKHHCRQCGRCVCIECAPNKNTKPIMNLGITDSVRHCKLCYRSPMVDWKDNSEPRSSGPKSSLGS